MQKQKLPGEKSESVLSHYHSYFGLFLVKSTIKDTLHDSSQQSIPLAQEIRKPSFYTLMG